MLTTGFQRLPKFYSAELLAGTKVVVVPRIQVPPLRSMGLPEFAAFETSPMDGITYLDTYFLRAGVEKNEAMHFHELVHVVQWRAVTAERFLLSTPLVLCNMGIEIARLKPWPTHPVRPITGAVPGCRRRLDHLRD